jgi:hypothetical protein
MSGYLKDNDGKTDWMIDGREGGTPPAHGHGARTGCATYRSKIATT